MTLNRAFLLVSFFILLYYSPAGGVFGHGFGQSFFKEANGYVLEFEYEALEIVEGEVVPYRFQFLEKDTSGSGKPRSPLMVANNVGSFLEFDDVLVRFNKAESGELVGVMRLAQDPLVSGLARFSGALDKGDYKVKLSFYKNEQKLAEAVFDHKVLPREKTVWDYWQHIVISVLFLVVIYLLYLLFRKTKNKK